MCMRIRHCVEARKLVGFVVTKSNLHPILQIATFCWQLNSFESSWFKVDGLARLLEGHHILSFGNMVYEISRWNNDERICLVIKFSG